MSEKNDLFPQIPHNSRLHAWLQRAEDFTDFLPIELPNGCSVEGIEIVCKSCSETTPPEEAKSAMFAQYPDGIDFDVMSKCPSCKVFIINRLRVKTKGREAHLEDLSHTYPTGFWGIQKPSGACS